MNPARSVGGISHYWVASCRRRTNVSTPGTSIIRSIHRFFRPVLILCFLVLPGFSTALAQQADNGAGTGAGTGQVAKKNKSKVSAARSGSDSALVPCPSKMPRELFFVDSSGSVSNTGRTYEGPLCIEVFYNPIQQFVGLQTTTTTAPGPDLSKVVLGGPSAGGVVTAKAEEKKPTSLPAAVSQLVKDANAFTGKLNQRKQEYGSAMQSQDQAISNISNLRRTTMLVSGDEAIAKVKSGYEGLRESLNSASTASTKFAPTDRVDNNKEVLLSQAQAQEDRLNTLPLDYANGTQADFVCIDSNDQIGWSAWFAKCKDSVYTPLKSIIDTNLQTAKDFASGSDNANALTKKIAIVQYWDSLFSTLGLRRDLLIPAIEALDISPAFYTSTAVRCGILFNHTSNTTVNIVAADLGPTLQGSDPTIKAQGAFVTVSCGTPFSVSAGVGFSSIEQKQFAIIQSPDGKGGTINTFGTSSDSKINPAALAVVHVRLAEWDRHKYAFHGSLGVGGNLQNQSNGSPVQFLPGVSASFWRTMFITVGPNIGNQTSLTGGFKVGDTVPSGITSVAGVTKTSYKVGFGLAITFTKP
jgi:hypothetical protein